MDILAKGLMETNLIEWHRLKQFSGMPERLVPNIAVILKEKGFRHSGDQFHFPCYLSYMSQSDAENYPIPE
jgi:hypothetical protein